MLPPSLLRFVKRWKYFPLFSTLDLIKPTCIRYRVIQSFSTTLNEVVRDMMCGRKCNFFFQICHRFRVTTFLHWRRFTVAIVDFFKMETFRFNITCHIFPLKFRVFWDVLPCSQVDVYWRFRGTYYLWRQYAPLKRRSASTWLPGSTSQKTLNFILAAVRPWNHIFSFFAMKVGTKRNAVLRIILHSSL
jgi:hypothetical protein